MKKNAAVKVMTPQRDRGSIAEARETVLKTLGEDPSREGLLRTPERSEKALRFLLSGHGQSIEQIVNGALFNVKTDEMVIVKDIEFYSLCEHHLLPFFGKMHVAYLPNSRVIGLSKIPRIVDVFARRLQVQERLTQEVADAIEEICEARHFCMMMRGVEKQNSSTTTSAMRGAFKRGRETRQEFLSLVQKNLA